MKTHVQIEAVTVTGMVIRTFGDLDLAKRWIARNRERLPPVIVEEVTRTEIRKPVYRPRIAL